MTPSVAEATTAIQQALNDGCRQGGPLSQDIAWLERRLYRGSSGTVNEPHFRVVDLALDGSRAVFGLVGRGTVDGIARELWCQGSCGFVDSDMQHPTFSVEQIFVAPSKSVWRRLNTWAIAVFVGLVLFIVAGIAGGYLLLRHALDVGPQRLTILELAPVAAAAGWIGSCGAALRSAMDRRSQGYEFDMRIGPEDAERAQWPPRADQPERFSIEMAPNFLLRPFLGAVIGVVGYLVITTGTAALAGGTDQTGGRLGVVGTGTVGGLAGMFAKSIWDNLNERTKSLFKG